jgi:hypothetical protein
MKGAGEGGELVAGATHAQQRTHRPRACSGGRGKIKIGESWDKVLGYRRPCCQIPMPRFVAVGLSQPLLVCRVVVWVVTGSSE